MRRFSTIFAGITVVVVALISLSACGGGSNKTNPVAAVVVTPATSSIDVGSTSLVLTATANDSGGNALSSQTFTFTTTAATAGATPVVSVADNGLVCAGKWDSTTTPVVCTPLPAANAVGTALVTATSNGVTSSPVTIYVHQSVDNITISPQSPSACVSQTGTLDFTAHAFSAGKDVTSTVGPLTWGSSLGTVATVAGKDNTTATVTAVAPGKTQIYASVSGTQSTPATFTTCPIKQIQIHVANGTATSASFATSATQALAADMLDVNNQPVANVTLNWTTSQPLVTPAAGGSLIGGSAGTSSITATCAPPTCNIGLPNSAVYSNAFVATVTGTGATTKVWVASTQTNSLVPIDSSTNTPGTALTLVDASSNPVNPNSLLPNRQGTKLYVGTDTGLIGIDVTSNTVSAPLTSAPGRVLAISPDGSHLIVSNTTAGQVYVVNDTGTSVAVQPYSIPGAVSADFSPDGSKAYIVGNGNFTVWSSTTTPVPVAVGGNASDVSFLATGALGYIAGTSGGIGVRATCDDSALTGVSVANTPSLIRTLPDGVHMIAVSSPDIDLINATVTPNPAQTPCPPVVDNSVTPTALGSFTPRQLILTSDGSKAFITSDVPGVLLGYDTVNKVAAPIQLGGGVTGTYTGGVTLDGTQLYVGTAGTNTVHRIDLTTGLDVQQIPVNFVPDLVAVQP